MATKKTLTTTSGLDPNIELVGGNGGIEPPATYAGDDKGEPVFGKQETILVTGEGSPREGDETSKTFRTIAGKAYCLTLTTGGVTVYGSDNPELTPGAVVLLTTKTAGQYIFIAISSYTTVNVDPSTQYVLTPLSFNGAFLGASSGGGGDSFDPSASQTITGAWVFQSTLQRETKASPALTDVMNSEMVNTALNSTVKLIGNQSIAGTKTFTGGITMDNDVPLVIGSGDNALKLHGEGASGSYVIEGANHIGFSVGTSFQDPVTYFDNVTVTSGAVLAIGSDQNALAFRADTTGRTITGGGPSTVWEINVNMAIGAPVTFRGNAEFTAGATRTTKANPVNTDLLNKEMGDAMYAKLSLLTSAEYTALATKDARTVYVTTDTSKVFIGSVAVNP